MSGIGEIIFEQREPPLTMGHAAKTMCGTNTGHRLWTTGYTSILGARSCHRHRRHAKYSAGIARALPTSLYCMLEGGERSRLSACMLSAPDKARLAYMKQGRRTVWYRRRDSGVCRRLVGLSDPPTGDRMARSSTSTRKAAFADQI